jgi:replication-associated recombination protein RarA
MSTPTPEQRVALAAANVLLSLSPANLAATRAYDPDKPTTKGGRGVTYTCQIPRHVLRDLVAALDETYPGVLDDIARDRRAQTDESGSRP